MRQARIALVLAWAALAALPAGAQAPELTPPEGAEQTGETLHELDAYELPVAPFGDGSATVRISGEIAWRTWVMPAGGRTVESVLAGYREALARQGMQRILDCAGADCGGFDFRFGAALAPAPDMLMDVRDFAQLTAGREDPAVYASVLVSRVGGRIFVQVVTVAAEVPGLRFVAPPIEPPPETEAVAPPAPEGTDDVPPAAEGEAVAESDRGQAPATPEASEDAGSAAAEPVAAPGTAADGRPMLERLLANGFVQIEGLDFGSGGAALTGNSAPALDEMAEMLKANPDLAVAIVGHSDNVGTLEVNIRLSRRRAEAVRTALIERGVAAGRLEASGLGYLAPRWSNATEEGRARNRRVELVLR